MPSAVHTRPSMANARTGLDQVIGHVRVAAEHNGVAQQGLQTSDHELVVRQWHLRRVSGLDLYTMLGVPGEEPRHIRDLAALIRAVRSAFPARLTLEVSLNPAFAKAQTPYERYATLRPEETRRRFSYLRTHLGDETGISWVSAIGDAMTYYQPVLSLGGPELAPVRCNAPYVNGTSGGLPSLN